MKKYFFGKKFGKVEGKGGGFGENPSTYVCKMRQLHFSVFFFRKLPSNVVETINRRFPMDMNKGLGCFADLKLDILCLNPDTPD
jgi:hypothetical protein